MSEVARVRSAETQDAEVCAELCQDALQSLDAKRGGLLFARREAGLLAKALLRPGGLSRLLADPRRRVFVGTIDGEVVGFASGRVDQPGEASMGVVDALYVSPTSRRSGVGQGLMSVLTQWFMSTGCRGIDASALPGDRDTKNFFEGAGFKARLLTMHKSL